MTAYVLVIVLAAGHHQPIAVGYPDQGSCLVAAERVRRNKKAHPECLKFVQGKWIVANGPMSISAVPLDRMASAQKKAPAGKPGPA
jgi:hypothetical protein